MRINAITTPFAAALALVCGNALGGAMPQEPLGDVSKRIRAEKEQKARQLKEVDVYQGRLTFKAIPKFSDVQKQSINGMEIQIRNSSSLAYRYAFTVKCADWSTVASGNIEGSVGAPKQKTVSIELPSPCAWSAASLEHVREAQGLEGPDPQEPRVSGIDDEELARQRKLQKVFDNAPSNSVSALRRRVDEACKGRSLQDLATAPVGAIGDQMTACAKAYDDLNAALQSQRASRNQASAEAVNQPAPGGAVVVRLTGTTGLPFTGTCSFSNRGGTTSKSYDDVLPFQVESQNVDTVNCSFISKSDFRHDMKLEILKNGNVIGESSTDAPYGLVSVARDVN